MAIEKEIPLFSFVITSYKNHEYIYEALDSVFSQDYPRIQLIISDDGSPNYGEHIDGIKQFVEANKKSNIIDVRYNRMDPNVGTVKHLNAVFSMARGEYIKDLGAGDTLNCQDALTKYVNYLEQNDCDICFARMRGVRPDGEYVFHLAACEDNYDLLRSLTVEQSFNRLFARNILPAPAWCGKK